MSTHAARTEAGEAAHAKMDAIQRAEHLAQQSFWRAAEVAERDRRDRCWHQGLPLYAEPSEPMLAAHAEEHDYFERVGKLCEWARDELLKKRASGVHRARNARR